MSDWSLQALLATWVVAALGLLSLYRAQRAPMSGLVFAYLVSLALIHWTGAFLYALPWYTSPQSAQVLTGFRQATYGLVALTAGIVTWLTIAAGQSSVRLRRSAQNDRQQASLSWCYLGIGLASYLLLIPLLGWVPTLGAVLAAAWSLFAIGVALKCRDASDRGRPLQLVLWLGAVFLTPALTIVTQGFLGYGVQVVTVVLVFLAMTTRHRLRWTILSILLVYPAMSFYVAYMAQRDALRQSVWGGDPVKRRVVRLYDTARTVEPFDVKNTAHLQFVDGRLNLNQLVGACVDYLANGAHAFADGETLWYGVIAIAPRIIWPDKPVVAGSMGMVTKYTGITFGAGTSVGIGQVMEFYMNFGVRGVVLGFFVLGLAVAAFDHAAAVALRSRDLAGFVFWFLPGMALLQAGGSMVEVTSSMAAGFVTAHVVNTHLLPALGFAPAGQDEARERRRRSAAGLPIANGVRTRPPALR